MNGKIIFKCDFYDLLIEKILNRLNNFIRYNPDDLNRNLLKKVIEEALSELINLSIDDIDKSFESYAKIRFYSDFKNGFYIKTNYDDIFIPDLNLDSIDQIEVEKTYVKNFFQKINEFISNSSELKQLIENDESEKLINILNKSYEHAVDATFKKYFKESYSSK